MTTVTLDPSNKHPFGTLSNGNLTWHGFNGVGAHQKVRATRYVAVGDKRYCEITADFLRNSYGIDVGVVDSSLDLTSDLSTIGSGNTYGVSYNGTDVVYDSSSSDDVTDLTASDVIMMAVYRSSSSSVTVWFGLNGTWFDGDDPEALSGGWAISLSNDAYVFVGSADDDRTTTDFDARTWLPDGFLTMEQDGVAQAGITEADDTIASAGGIFSAGQASVTEGDDTISSIAALTVAARAAVTEAGDTVASAAGLTISATAAIGEADDTLASVAATGSTATASITEEGDSITAAAGLTVTGALAVDEADDTITAAGKAGYVARLELADGDDTISSAAGLTIGADLALPEADDTVDASAFHRIPTASPKRHLSFPEARRAQRTLTLQR